MEQSEEEAKSACDDDDDAQCDENMTKVEQEENDREECAICYQPFALKITLPTCGHSFCFLCIKGVARRHGACPLCRKPIRNEIFKDPVLTDSDANQFLSKWTNGSEKVASSSNSLQQPTVIIGTHDAEGGNIRWFYQGRRGGWWRYEPRQEAEIEMAYRKGASKIELLIAGFTYCIDFVDWCQYRKDVTRSAHWERAIKRVSDLDVFDGGTVRGIAGLRTPASNTDIETTLSRIHIDH